MLSHLWQSEEGGGGCRTSGWKEITKTWDLFLKAGEGCWFGTGRAARHKGRGGGLTRLQALYHPPRAGAREKGWEPGKRTERPS